MGKKEKAIRRLNAEFYKQYNKIDTDEYLETKEEIKERKLQETIQKEENKANKLIEEVKFNMLEYVDTQGLSMLEKSTDFAVNIENYIYRLLDGSFNKSENYKSSTYVSECEVSEEEFEQNISDEEENINDIHITKEQIVIELGEYELFKDYVKHNIKKQERIQTLINMESIMPVLRNQLLKITGKEEYFKHINILGNYEYKLIEKKLLL